MSARVETSGPRREWRTVLRGSFRSSTRSQQHGAVGTKRWPGVAFVLPALAITGLFLGYPIVQAVRLSFFNWNGLDPVQTFVGLRNYDQLFNQDPYFWLAVRNTALWAAVTVPVQLFLGLGLALLLNQKLRLRVAFRTIYFIPVVLSPVVIAIAWSTIYDPTIGLANNFTGAVGLGRHHGWLGDPTLALPAAMLVSAWRYCGLIMLFYLAGLQMIPTSLYEAARVDGASEWQQLRRITLPLLKPMTALLIMLGTIGALREFDMVYVLTGGGPAHQSDLLSIQVFHQAFGNYEVGYSSAIATLLLLLTMIVAMLQLGNLARAHRSVGG